MSASLVARGASSVRMRHKPGLVGGKGDPGEVANSPIGLSMAYFGILGDGSASDMSRLNTAMLAASAAKCCLVPERGKSYRFASQIVIPGDYTGFVGNGSAEFHFYATDAFTSTTKPNYAGSVANGVLIYALNRAGFRMGGFKLVFHGALNSYVHGLNVRGSHAAEIEKLEAIGFNSGYPIKIDSSNDVLIDRPYVHDCEMNRVGPAYGDGQLSAISYDDDKLPAGASIGGQIVNPRIARLTATADTRAGVGFQTDGLTFSPLTESVLVSGGTIADVDEGVDVSGGVEIAIVGTKFRNARLWGIKFIHGAKNCTATNTSVDGAGIAAIQIAGSSTSTPTKGNLIRGTRVTRVGDPSITTTAGAKSVIRIDDTGYPQPMIDNTILDTTAWNCTAGTGILARGGSAAAGNRVSGFTFDASITTPVDTGGTPASKVVVANVGNFSVGITDSPIFGGIERIGTAAARSTSFDAEGVPTTAFDDGSARVVRKLRNNAVAASGQGVMLDTFLGASLTLSHRETLLSTDTYATAGAQSSAWSWQAQLAGNLSTVLVADPKYGIAVGGIKSAANDAAAATAGVPVNAFYRDGSGFVRIRLT